MKNKCANCKKPLGNEVGESGIYQSRHLLCLPCWEEEDALMDTEETNSPEYSEAIRNRLNAYGHPNDV